jgi:ABC-2 type transport system permease protein
MLREKFMTTANAPARGISLAKVQTGFMHVLMAEWIKFASLRSNLWTLIASAATVVGLGIVFVFAHLDLWSGFSAAELASVDPIHESFIGLWFAGILGFGVTGALAMTAEYSSGTIQSTFAAIPRRLHILAAKTIVISTVVFIVGTVASVAVFFAAQPLLAQESLDVSITDSGILFAVMGGGLYATGAAAIGLALGTIIRRTAATLVAVTITFPLATLIGLALPESWSNVTQFLPHAAGLAIISAIDHSDLLSPTRGLLVLSGWTVAGLAVAAILLQRRDINA